MSLLKKDKMPTPPTPGHGYRGGCSAHGPMLTKPCPVKNCHNGYLTHPTAKGPVVGDTRCPTCNGTGRVSK